MADVIESGRRVALITGGGRGIGAAIARLLGRDGMDVAIVYAGNEAAAAKAADLVRSAGAKATTHQGSVDDEQDCEKVVAEIVAAHGRLDVIVNNAGVASSGRSIDRTSGEEIRRLMGVHAFGPAYLARIGLPHLRRQARGDIIFVSSAAVPLYPANSGPYTMAKAAGEALARTLAHELNGEGVFVNIVAPGPVATDMGNSFAHATAQVGDITELDAEMPRGHVCRPEEVAEVVAFLCSPRNSYVSGQRIAVEGAQMTGERLTARVGARAAR